MRTEDAGSLTWREPWRPGGVASIWRRRRLIWELSKAQRSKRYQGMILGRIWAYIGPITQFTVYFFVIGIILGLSRQVQNFPLYIFSGLVVVQFFNASLTACTRSITESRAIVRRTAVPHVLLPLSRVVTEVVRLGPPLVVLLVAALATGWRLDAAALLVAIAGMALLTLFVAGLGTITAVADVFVRDTRQFVDVTTMLTRWATPVIYPWTLVQDQFGDGWLTWLYLANPVTIATFGMREAFWQPTVEEGLPPMPLPSLVIGITVAVLAVAVAAVVLRRFDQGIVQRLRWSA